MCPSESLYGDIESDQREFLNAMELYEANAEPKYKLHVNMKETHSLDDVLRSIDEAKKNYDAKEAGFFGSIRKAFRKLGDNESVCNTWLGLLPGDSEYFSIICGGLKMIFGVKKPQSIEISRLKDHRLQDIFGRSIKISSKLW